MCFILVIIRFPLSCTQSIDIDYSQAADLSKSHVKINSHDDEIQFQYALNDFFIDFSSSEWTEKKTETKRRKNICASVKDRLCTCQNGMAHGYELWIRFASLRVVFLLNHGLNGFCQVNRWKSIAKLSLFISFLLFSFFPFFGFIFIWCMCFFLPTWNRMKERKRKPKYNFGYWWRSLSILSLCWWRNWQLVLCFCSSHWMRVMNISSFFHFMSWFSITIRLIDFHRNDIFLTVCYPAYQQTFATQRWTNLYLFISIKISFVRSFVILLAYFDKRVNGVATFLYFTCKWIGFFVHMAPFFLSFVSVKVSYHIRNVLFPIWFKS